MKSVQCWKYILYDSILYILEKPKLQTQITDQWLPGFSEDRVVDHNRMRTGTFRMMELCSVWYSGGGHMAFHSEKLMGLHTIKNELSHTPILKSKQNVGKSQNTMHTVTNESNWSIDVGQNFNEERGRNGS